MKKRVFSAFLCVLLLLSTFSFFCTFAAGADGLIIHQVYGLAEKDAAPVSSSFLEIYNTSNQPVSLAGVSVQYRKKAGDPFTVCALNGEKTVAAGNFGADEGFYLVLFDDGLDKDMAKLLLAHFDEQHEELVIDNKAFQLALVSGTEPIADLSDAAVLDAVDLLSGPLAGTISKQKALRRVSPEKAAEFEVVHYGDADAEQATAWAPRCAAGKLNVCEPPQEEATLAFSKEAGLYDEPFDLTVSASNGAAVYYTLDGSDPRQSQTRMLYQGPIAILNGNEIPLDPSGPTRQVSAVFGDSTYDPSGHPFRGVVVKAAADGGTKVFTNTYFVDSGLAQKFDMPFVSVSLEPRDFISADQGIYFLTMLDPFGTKQRRNANFELFETDGARISSQYIELSLHGNGSLGAHQKSMRAYFKKNPEEPDSKSGLKYDVFQGGATDSDGNAILQYDRLIMRNSGNDVGKTMMRDAFIQRVSKTLNLDTQASRPSLVFINGEFWGLYNLRERYDDKYFASHYGISDSDVVMLEAPTPLVTGNDNTMYEVNEGAEGDEQPFIDMFHQAISTDLSVQANYEAIASQMDVDNYIDFFIANIITCNYDWPGNNIKVWRNKNENQTKIDNKWRWVMADMDHGYGFVDPNNDWSKDMMHHALDGGSIATQLFRALLKNEGFQQKFVDRFVYAVNEIYDADKGIALIDEMAAEREKAIPLQSVRWPADGNSVSNFNYQVGVMRTFAQKRPAVALSQMYAYLGLSQTPNFKVVSDGAMGTCLVNNQSAVDGVYAKECAPGEKVTVSASAKTGFAFVGFAVSKADGSESFYEGETQTFTLSSDLCVRAIFRKEAYVSLNTLLAGTQNLSALSSAGLLYSWGGNNSAQNGNGFSSGLVSSPAIAAGGVKFAAVSNGGAGADVTTTVYITEDGSVYTFGGNSSGQLGRSGDTTVGQKVSFPQKAVMAAAGYDHTLVLLENGDLYGAGSNSNGQLGNPLEVGANFYTFVKVAENVKYVTAGRRHTLFIDNDGNLYGLGDNRWNKLSDEIGASYTAVPVKIKEDVSYAMAGGHNTFYVTEDGTCYYRGWRSLSFDNTASANTEIVFHQIASGVREIAMQESHALILANDGTLYGWGENGSGQILQGGSALYETPVKIMDGVSQAAAGLGFSAALLEDGTVLCWGSNSLGICANGTATGGVVPPTPAMRLGGVLAQKTAFTLGAQELSVLSQGDVGVTVRFANTTGQAQDVMVYLACYDAAGVLLDVKTMKATVGPGFSSQMQGGKTVVVDKNTVKVKAFLWDEAQRPIQAAVQLPKSA